MIKIVKILRMKMKTLIIGASENPERYSFKAAHRLVENGHEIYLIGNKKGSLLGREIVNEKKQFDDVHSVTMYVSEKNQKEYYDYIVSLKPHRVIFNPGTENEEFSQILKNNKIHVEVACTLVLLSIGAY
jgi:uncharacterized protein